MDIPNDFPSWRLQRRYGWEEMDDGRVIVRRPRLGEGKWGRKIAGLLGFEDYKIRLDEVGTVVWKNCDGETTADQIAEELRNNFGEKIEPAEDRLALFIQQLSRARMISIQK